MSCHCSWPEHSILGSHRCQVTSIHAGIFLRGQKDWTLSTFPPASGSWVTSEGLLACPVQGYFTVLGWALGILVRTKMVYARGYRKSPLDSYGWSKRGGYFSRDGVVAGCHWEAKKDKGNKGSGVSSSIRGWISERKKPESEISWHVNEGKVDAQISAVKTSIDTEDLLAGTTGSRDCLPCWLRRAKSTRAYSLIRKGQSWRKRLIQARGTRWSTGTVLRDNTEWIHRR